MMLHHVKKNCSLWKGQGMLRHRIKIRKDTLELWNHFWRSMSVIYRQMYGKKLIVKSKEV